MGGDTVIYNLPGQTMVLCSLGVTSASERYKKEVLADVKRKFPGATPEFIAGETHRRIKKMWAEFLAALREEE
jgi:hypothetical protein